MGAFRSKCRTVDSCLVPPALIQMSDGGQTPPRSFLPLVVSVLFVRFVSLSCRFAVVSFRFVRFCRSFCLSRSSRCRFRRRRRRRRRRRLRRGRPRRPRRGCGRRLPARFGARMPVCFCELRATRRLAGAPAPSAADRLFPAKLVEVVFPPPVPAVKGLLAKWWWWWWWLRRWWWWWWWLRRW